MPERNTWHIISSPQRKLGMAVLVSMMLHAMLLQGTSGRGGASVSVPPVAGALVVRLVPHILAEAPDATSHQALGEARSAGSLPPLQGTPGSSPTADHVHAPPLAALQRDTLRTEKSTPSAPLGERDPTYYTARELDFYPAPLAPLDLTPPAGTAAMIAARVLLELRVDDGGAVTGAQVLESGAEAEWADAVRRAFIAHRFTPARRNGVAVKSRVVVEVAYDSSGP
jgi:periplasmic protein TonB